MKMTIKIIDAIGWICDELQVMNINFSKRLIEIRRKLEEMQ